MPQIAFDANEIYLLLTALTRYHTRCRHARSAKKGFLRKLKALPQPDQALILAVEQDLTQLDAEMLCLSELERRLRKKNTQP